MCRVLANCVLLELKEAACWSGKWKALTGMRADGESSYHGSGFMSWERGA